MAAVPRSGTPEKSAAPSRPVRERPPATPAVMRRRLLAVAAAAVGVALLFVAYLQLSRTYPENSDSANILLMSWDMLHGNVLLHGWYLSDVSFYPTELPQYAMLEGLLGLHVGTAHVAAAMTYTLVVIFAVLLARGPRDRAAGRAAWPRMALTGALMIAPQLGVGVFVLLLSVGHIGTAVPLMLTWLVIDRAAAKQCLPGTPQSREDMVRSGHRRAAADLGPGGRSAGARGGDRPPRRGLCHARPARRLRPPVRRIAARPCRRAGTRCPWPPRRSSPTVWPTW